LRSLCLELERDLRFCLFLSDAERDRGRFLSRELLSAAFCEEDCLGGPPLEATEDDEDVAAWGDAEREVSVSEPLLSLCLDFLLFDSKLLRIVVMIRLLGLLGLLVVMIRL
jgi:hypothetical protein